MLQRIQQSLSRQSKGVALLGVLMREEFSLLQEHKPQDVTRLEFSIQELMGQLVAERKALKAMLHGMRLMDYLEALALADPAQEALRAEIYALLQQVDAREQECAKQAEMNSTLVLGLMDQGHKMLAHLQEQVIPKAQAVYSRHGRYSGERPQAALLEGKL